METDSYLAVEVADVPLVPGDAFIYKKVKRVVVYSQATGNGTTILLDYRNVELSNPLASFPMREAT